MKKTKKIIRGIIYIIILGILSVFGITAFNVLFGYKSEVKIKIESYVDGILEDTDNEIRNLILDGTEYEVKVIDKQNCIMTITSIDMDSCMDDVSKELSKTDIPEDEEMAYEIVQDVFEDIVEDADEKNTYEISLTYLYENGVLTLNTTSEFYDVLFGGSFSLFESMIEKE